MIVGSASVEGFPSGERTVSVAPAEFVITLAALPRSQPFFGNAIKPPISAAVTGTGNSSVFRHAVPRAGFFYEAGPSSASFKSGRHGAETPVDLGAEPTRSPAACWLIGSFFYPSCRPALAR